MSDSALKRIEKAIERLGRQQEEICERLAGLEQRAEKAGAPTPSEVARFLDKFAAGEAFGEELFGAWIEVCQTDCLRGGLRTIQQREGMHARLLRERMKELGFDAREEIPDETREAAFKTLGGSDMTDAQKLATFMSQFPDADAALAELSGMAARLSDDQETQSLLQTIEQDERSSLGFLAEACALLNPKAA